MTFFDLHHHFPLKREVDSGACYSFNTGTGPGRGRCGRAQGAFPLGRAKKKNQM